MDSASTTEYEHIKVTFPVVVEPVDHIRLSLGQASRSIFVMGPTGAGKSSFIEALGYKGDHSISSNRLEGFTQVVSTYRTNIVTLNNHPMFLVDSPGFADTKISEIAIVSMLKKWIQDNTGHDINQILYLIPITQIRLAGSQRQVLKTFQALTGINTAGNVAIVTTMWDSIFGEHAMKRAEETFNEFQNHIWKEFIQKGAQIMKFDNTQHSALSILDQAFQRGSTDYFSLEEMVRFGQDLKFTPFATNIYNDLHTRIQSLNLEIANLRSDLAHAEAQDDLELLSVLRPRLEEAEKTLAQFEKEFDEVNPAPKSPVSPMYDSTANTTPDTPVPAISLTHRVDLTPPTSTSPHLIVPSSTNPDNLRKTLGSPPAAEEVEYVHKIPKERRGLLAHTMHSMMCCGNSVAQNHDV